MLCTSVIDRLDVFNHLQMHCHKTDTLQLSASCAAIYAYQKLKELLATLPKQQEGKQAMQTAVKNIMILDVASEDARLATMDVLHTLADMTPNDYVLDAGSTDATSHHDLPSSSSSSCLQLVLNRLQQSLTDCLEGAAPTETCRIALTDLAADSDQSSPAFSNALLQQLADCFVLLKLMGLSWGVAEVLPDPLTGLLWSIVEDKSSAIGKLFAVLSGEELTNNPISSAHIDLCVWLVHATVVLGQQLTVAPEQGTWTLTLCWTLQQMMIEIGHTAVACEFVEQGKLTAKCMLLWLLLAPGCKPLQSSLAYLHT